MNRRSLLVTASILLAGNNGAQAFSPAAPTNNVSSRQCTPSSTSIMMSSSSNRRNFLNNFSKAAAGAMLIGVTGTAANALDFDAFAAGEIAQDVEKCDPKRDPKCIPKLTEDEALCQYGGGGKSKGEACLRIRKAGGKLPEVKKEKSLGGAYAM
mmetsp:Transcript_29499/g.62607  ORF Transcript_29499/g.62607 Transcript_29499/m.62607 type:complete len:154 (-) Transcript_29499:264-725(-)|eukprot:CAMPEP_0172299850 /NCGR_PEP_ID=MMETSP1058-20130122/2042_1 /TAXON_ID=83371 /ORGANISM="Detonula confervacea, Strain CCMP 353" /LENGTH=153 /DNA_ID=CAMNT_0013009421 /DNA_START=101 /DNA_END=562 /DNA_ORIENTATION=+